MNIYDIKASITPAEALSIIEIACTDWKKKLATQWGPNIVLEVDVPVTNGFYNAMINASNDFQKKVIENIFNKLSCSSEMEIGQIMKISSDSKEFDGYHLLRIAGDTGLVILENVSRTYASNAKVKGVILKEPFEYTFTPPKS